MDNSTYQQKYNNYVELLNLTYEEVTDYLKNKYGEVIDDYFREKSYLRFLNGEIKNITKGKYSRAKEGLYCHHIYEDKFLNLSNQSFIGDYKYDFEYQRKENLVYCDLFEHIILHALIMMKTNVDLGFPGYVIYLKPKIQDWYINKIDPKPFWMKQCKERAYLPTSLVEDLLSKIEDKLMDYKKFRNKMEEHNRLEKLSEKLEKERDYREQQQANKLGITIDEFKTNRESILAEEDERRDILNNLIELLTIKYQSKEDQDYIEIYDRESVLRFLYLVKYKKDYSYDNFKSKKLNFTKQKLGFELLKYIDEALKRLTTFKYYYIEEKILNEISKSIELLIKVENVVDYMNNSIYDKLDFKEEKLNNYIFSLDEDNSKNPDLDFIKNLNFELNKYYNKITKINKMLSEI
ncbi:hypothetical protein ACUXJN_000496 [Staphylococcus capitis]